MARVLSQSPEAVKSRKKRAKKKRARATWKQMEDAFRLWAFQVYYERAYATIQDGDVRFVSAIVASAKPIPDKRVIRAWWRIQHRHSNIAGQREMLESLARTIGGMRCSH